MENIFTMDRRQPSVIDKMRRPLSKRLEKWYLIPTHIYHGRYYKKLKLNEAEWAHEWLLAHDHLDKREFEMAVNRIGMDQPTKSRFKNEGIIAELLASTNT